MPVSKYTQNRKAAVTASGKLKKPDVFMCTRCGNVFNKADHKKKFTTVKSPLWESNEYKLPICNDCLKFYYDFYQRALGDPHAAYRRICMKFDIYYNSSIVNSILANEQSADRIGAYITQLNYARYQGKTYDSTIEEEDGEYLYREHSDESMDENEDVISLKAEYEKLKVQLADKDSDELENLPEFEEKFGGETGYKIKEQEIMLNLYNEQLEHIPPQLVTSLNETIKDLARFKILRNRAVAHDEMKEITNYSNQFNAARKYIDSAVDKYKKNASTEENSVILGNVAQMIENFCPATLWKKPDAFEDIDNLNNNVKSKIVRCVKNFFTGSRESDPEFKLPDREV